MNHKVKGFTLIEMIVVVAIIGILLGVLTPAMWNYYRRSRIQAANSDAKMVYNAAQTAVQKYIGIDRVHDPDSGLSGAVVIAYNYPVAGQMRNTAAGNNLPATNATDDTISEVACQDVVDSVNRTVSGASEICWMVSLDKYIVKAAVAAENATALHVGYYSADKQFATMDDPRQAYQDVAKTRLEELTTHYNTLS
jgi:prepilin-type N-terminal cleavage/methylation domain-containing protein